MFNGVSGGTGRAIDALASALGERLVTGSSVTALEPEPDGGFSIVAADRDRRARAVILTTPPSVTAELIRPHAPRAATALCGIELADVVLVTFVFTAADLDHPLDGSGYLVPRSEGLLTTACSWASSKWAHYDDGAHAVLRVSAGRTDDRRWLALDDDALVDRLRAELQITMGTTATPLAVRVTRWMASLPQYRPGHLELVAGVESELAENLPGVQATGAGFRGLGLPACVRQGRAAGRAAVALVSS